MAAANGQHGSVSCTSGESSVGHHGEAIILFSFPREIYAVYLLKCKMDGNSFRTVWCGFGSSRILSPFDTVEMNNNKLTIAV